MNQNDKIRIVLIRHGQPQQHQGKIFLGQVDIPLSSVGIEEASLAGEKLISENISPDMIYASDLLRAFETAEIISQKLEGVQVVPDKLFREMNMGSWDGEFIEEIKEKFPEEYEKRGEDILNYRIPGGENFYDLRGRVAREFYRLFMGEFQERLKDGGSKDFVLVAHMGVIRSLMAELTQDEEEATWKRPYPTGSVTVIEAPEWLVTKS